MKMAALGLMDGRSVPVQSEPLERPEDDVDQFRPRPFGIGVFDAEHEFTAALAGEEPVEEGGPRTSDM
jgi:hypothetical protein